MDRNDDALNSLLREWKAPETPADLEQRVLTMPKPWWRILIFGYLRVPVPVACALAITIVLGAWRLAHDGPSSCSPQSTATVPATVPAQPSHGCAPNSRC